MHTICEREYGNEIRTDVVGDVEAVAEPSGGDGAGEVDAVVGIVGLVGGRPRQVVVVADVQYRGPEHVHRRWPTAGGDDGADEHYLMHRYHKAQQKTTTPHRCRPTYTCRLQVATESPLLSVHMKIATATAVLLAYLP